MLEQKTGIASGLLQIREMPGVVESHDTRVRHAFKQGIRRGIPMRLVLAAPDHRAWNRDTGQRFRPFLEQPLHHSCQTKASARRKRSARGFAKRRSIPCLRQRGIVPVVRHFLTKDPCRDLANGGHFQRPWYDPRHPCMHRMQRGCLRKKKTGCPVRRNTCGTQCVEAVCATERKRRAPDAEPVEHGKDCVRALVQRMVIRTPG